MDRVLDHLTIHKWRRAPYGVGAMSNEAKETAAFILRRYTRVGTAAGLF